MENYENLDGFKAWYAEEKLYIIAKEYASPGLKSTLNDAFKGFVLLKERVFLPIGRGLMPRIPELMILRNYQADNAYLVFDDSTGELEVQLLPLKGAASLTHFLDYFIESRVKSFAPYQSQWRFDFNDLKKKAHIIELNITED